MKGGKKSLEQFSGYTLTDDTGTEEQMAALDFSAAFRVLRFLPEKLFIDLFIIVIAENAVAYPVADPGFP